MSTYFFAQFCRRLHSYLHTYLNFLIIYLTIMVNDYEYVQFRTYIVIFGTTFRDTNPGQNKAETPHRNVGSKNIQ